MRELSRQILNWIDNKRGWFTSWQLDEALGITTKKDKILRRVTLKRLCDKGSLVRHPDNTRYSHCTAFGIYKNVKPAKRLIWQM